MTPNGWWYPSASQQIYAYQKAWIFAGGGGGGGGGGVVFVLFCFVFWIDEELVHYVN